MIECVPNVSEGHDHHVIAQLRVACGSALLDVHTDADHHRTVFTMVASPDELAPYVKALARTSVDLLDIGRHRGEHPRLGVLDVVPFIALDGDDGPCVEAAMEFARWCGRELEIPVFLYGDAHPSSRTLPDVRANAFRTIAPDFGPPVPHRTAGATCVGVRPFLVAVNCELDTDDLSVAQHIARAVRERNGGLPGVRALGFRLTNPGRTQVSMNVTDLERTSTETACSMVQRVARGVGHEITKIELVGLVPRREFDRWTVAFRQWSQLDERCTIEWRQQHAIE